MRMCCIFYDFTVRWKKTVVAFSVMCRNWKLPFKVFNSFGFECLRHVQDNGLNIIRRQVRAWSHLPFASLDSFGDFLFAHFLPKLLLGVISGFGIKCNSSLPLAIALGAMAEQAPFFIKCFAFPQICSLCGI